MKRLEHKLHLQMGNGLMLFLYILVIITFAKPESLGYELTCSLHASVAGVMVAVLAALAAFVACKRRRSATGCLPGRPQAKPDLSGLPTTLRPSVYKQVMLTFKALVSSAEFFTSSKSSS